MPTKEDFFITASESFFFLIMRILLSLLLLSTNNVFSDKWDFRNTRYALPTIVHLFEWQWSDIANECENWLPTYGFGAVQVKQRDFVPVV